MSGCILYCVVSVACAYLHWSISRIMRLRPYPLLVCVCAFVCDLDTCATCSNARVYCACVCVCVRICVWGRACEIYPLFVCECKVSACFAHLGGLV